MKKTRKRKQQEDPEIMCGLCQQTTMMWMATEAPPQVIFDTLSCFLAGIVAKTVVADHQQDALDYVTGAAKDMIEAHKRAGRLN